MKPNHASASPKMQQGAVSLIPKMSILTAFCLTFAGNFVCPTIASGADLPASPSTPSAEHHVGKMVFAQLVTPNLGDTKRFYGQLLGWQFQDTTVGDTVLSDVSIDGDDIARIVGRDRPQSANSQPAWLPFFAAQDLPSLRTTAVQLGAKVMFEPHDVPNLGSEAVFVDPQGAVFAALAFSRGDPPDDLAEAGEWIWSSLVTTNPDTDAAFYQTLFHYDVFELPGDADAQHMILATDDYARASINPLPPHTGAERPQWISYLRVEDTTASVAKAVALGGHILVQPQLDRHGSRIAVVADPLGAVFGLMEWSSQTQSGGTK